MFITGLPAIKEYRKRYITNDDVDYDLVACLRKKAIEYDPIEDKFRITHLGTLMVAPIEGNA